MSKLSWQFWSFTISPATPGDSPCRLQVQHAHAVVLHRERARLEPHQPIAVDRARHRGHAVDGLLRHQLAASRSQVPSALPLSELRSCLSVVLAIFQPSPRLPRRSPGHAHVA